MAARLGTPVRALVRVVRSYVWGEGIDSLLAVRIGVRTYAALTDEQGTVWGFADGGGRIAARWTYDAWGNVLSEEIAPWAGELRAVRYRFQGRERSAATGLVHFRARWYDPVTGRWLSPDPIGLEGGLNLHAFCGNDPVNYTDPSGLISMEEIGARVSGFCDGFTDDFWGNFGRGLAATADGFIPWVEPFESVYSDECGNYDEVYGWSRMSGTVSFEIVGLALTAAPSGITIGGGSRIVTHWSPSSVSALKPGDWVMTGGATIRNRVMAGFKSAWKDSITVEVPRSALSWPRGWEWLKGFLGQRMYNP